MKKNVLIVAYAYEPNEPSEPGVGWNFTQEISKFMNVTVLTRENNRNVIEKICGKDINYIYYDLPNFFMILKKRIPFGLQIYYTLWQWGAYLNINKLTRKHINSFDVCHHLTFGMTKIVPPAFLIKLPFIWGPIGGGDLIPYPFLKDMSLKANIEELIYYILHKGSNISPLSFLTRKKAKAIIFRTFSVEKHFPKNGCKNRFIIPETANSNIIDSPIKEKTSFIHAVCIGRMIHGKGYIYALKGFHEFLKYGGEGKIVFLGNGPEEKKLKAYTKKNNLQKNVFFKGFVKHDEVKQELQQADILLHPSFREGGSWSIMEAMSYGVPVISLNTSGPKDMVTKNCGLLIDMLEPKQVVEDIGKGLLSLSNDLELFNQLSKNAQERIKTEYTWDNLGNQIKKVYLKLLTKENRDEDPINS